MRWFERQLAAHLTRPDPDEAEPLEGADYVDGALRVMPMHLRVGILTESFAFGAGRLLLGRAGRRDATTADRVIARCRTSRIDVVRQYVRVFESLVLFAENELLPEAAA